MAVDWSRPMSQTFEYCEVDPDTWGDSRVLANVISSSVTRDMTSDTLGSASLTVEGTLGEAYVREYLVARQNGERQRVPLGVHLVQTPSFKFDGKTAQVTLDCYTPLVELREKHPPLGYTIPKGANVMAYAYDIAADNMRAPVTEPRSDRTLDVDFTANSPQDTWLSFVTDLVAKAEFHLELTPNGELVFAPNQQTAAMSPTWRYSDDNSSILLPDLDASRDLYGVPNTVYVVYSGDSGVNYTGTAVNEDESSPTSVQARGRVIDHWETNPSLGGVPTAVMVQEYAESLLESLSSVEYTVKYSHGYCPVQVGQAVLLNYTRATVDGRRLSGVKARVTSQSITCGTGCTVSETATYSTRYWEA